MASAHAKSREMWEGRVSVITSAIAKLVDQRGREKGQRIALTAAEVAVAIDPHHALQFWTPEQLNEFPTWIQRAGRRAFPGVGRPYANCFEGGLLPVAYEDGKFWVPA